MKYTVIYGTIEKGYSEQTNNKANAIKWANDRIGRATVILTTTGDILYENAAQRRINDNLTKLHKIAEAVKEGALVIK